MSEPMKIRARMVDGSAHIIVLMIHPMETGQRKDPRSGQAFPA
ncbi:MAG: thiosulfate oxidation carrier complex protein SoxZ, partial [Rhodocyclaceae bacterium]|nr:thiosulfate oxidation carrier complex protein SoxZ [Rhodocyclaceae bacterium]